MVTSCFSKFSPLFLPPFLPPPTRPSFYQPGAAGRTADKFNDGAVPFQKPHHVPGSGSCLSGSVHYWKCPVSPLSTEGLPLCSPLSWNGGRVRKWRHRVQHASVLKPPLPRACFCFCFAPLFFAVFGSRPTSSLQNPNPDTQQTQQPSVITCSCSAVHVLICNNKKILQTMKVSAWSSLVFVLSINRASFFYSSGVMFTNHISAAILPGFTDLVQPYNFYHTCHNLPYTTVV